MNESMPYLAISTTVIVMLIPLIPAIIILWLFPDTKVAVSGLLAQLPFNATGAFAAWVVGVLVMGLSWGTIHDSIQREQRPIWEIKGDIAFVGDDQQPIIDQARKNELIETLRQNVELHTNPPELTLGSDMDLKIAGVDSGIPTITLKFNYNKQIILTTIKVDPLADKSKLDDNDFLSQTVKNHLIKFDSKTPIKIHVSGPSQLANNLSGDESEKSHDEFKRSASINNDHKKASKPDHSNKHAL